MGGDNVGAAIYDARIDTTRLKTDARNAEKIVEGTGEANERAAARSTKAWNNFAKVGIATAAAAVVAATAAITKNLDNAIARVDTLNNSSRTFANMGFEASVSAKAVKALETSIMGLPTPLDSAIRGMTALAATYGDVDKGQKVFTALNNAILGFGGTADMVDNALMQLSQLPMDGPLDAQTWNSLRNSGLTPVLVAMAKESGTSVSKMRKAFGDGELTVQDFTNRLIQMNEKGGGGLKSLELIAKDSTKGISTSWANMNTAIARGVANIIESIGSERIAAAITSFGKGFESMLKTVPELLTNIARLGQVVGTYLGPKLTTLWQTIQTQVVPALTYLWKNVVEPLAPVLGTVLVVAIGAVIDVANHLITAAGWLWQQLEAGNPIIWGLIGVLGTLGVAMALRAGLAAMSAAVATVTTVLIPTMTASVSGFAALVASPIVFPALVIGAALASIAAVVNAYQNARSAIQRESASIDASLQTSKDLINAAQKAYSAGRIDKKEYNRLIGVAQRAKGGPVAAGMPYLVGENKDGSVNRTTELFVPKSAGHIYNAEQLRGLMDASGAQTAAPTISTEGMSGSSGATFNINQITIAKEVDGERWLRRLTGDQEIVAAGLVPRQEYGGSHA